MLAFSACRLDPLWVRRQASRAVGFGGQFLQEATKWNPCNCINVQDHPKEVNFFQREGYLVAHDALTPAEVEALRWDAVRICPGDWAMSAG